MSALLSVGLAGLAIAAMMFFRLLISRALLQTRAAAHSDGATDAGLHRYRGCGRARSDMPERSQTDAT